MELVRAPTNVATIVGRVQINGAGDAPAVHAIQDQFTLTPLHADSAPAAPIPQPDPAVPEALRWWETFRVQLAAFPPPAADAPILAIAETLGLTASESPYSDADAELADVLVAGAEAGQETIETLATRCKRRGPSTSVTAFAHPETETASAVTPGATREA